MPQPLAIVLYSKLLPGSQLVNRLQDLSYRVQAVSDPAGLAKCAESAGPMLVLADLLPDVAGVCAAISSLKANPATQHIPVVAFVTEMAAETESLARESGATLTTTDSALLSHLPEMLQQALQSD